MTRTAILVALVAGLAAVVVASFAIGARDIDLSTTIAALVGRGEGTDGMVVVDLRGPRTVIGLVAGAALGLAGALMQGVTRNPLADPGDRKSTRLNSSHRLLSRMPSSA